MEAPAEAPAVVEDAPFQAVLLQVEGRVSDQMLRFTTNMGDVVIAGPDHALSFPGGIAYLHVRHGLMAKIARPVHYQLADLVLSQAGTSGVWSGGLFFALENTS